MMVLLFYIKAEKMKWKMLSGDEHRSEPNEGENFAEVVPGRKDESF